MRHAWKDRIDPWVQGTSWSLWRSHRRCSPELPAQMFAVYSTYVEFRWEETSNVSNQIFGYKREPVPTPSPIIRDLRKVSTSGIMFLGKPIPRLTINPDHSREVSLDTRVVRCRSTNISSKRHSTRHQPDCTFKFQASKQGSSSQIGATD